MTSTVEPRRGSVYCHVCAACDHPLWRHGLVQDGDVRDGPYNCQDCECAIAQDAPWYGLTQKEYEQYRRQMVRSGKWRAK